MHGIHFPAKPFSVAHPVLKIHAFFFLIPPHFSSDSVFLNSVKKECERDRRLAFALYCIFNFFQVGKKEFREEGDKAAYIVLAGLIIYSLQPLTTWHCMRPSNYC